MNFREKEFKVKFVQKGGGHFFGFPFKYYEPDENGVITFPFSIGVANYFKPKALKQAVIFFDGKEIATIPLSVMQ